MAGCYYVLEWTDSNESECFILPTLCACALVAASRVYIRYDAEWYRSSLAELEGNEEGFIINMRSGRFLASRMWVAALQDFVYKQIPSPLLHGLKDGIRKVS